MRVTFEVEDGEALRVLRRVLTALDLLATAHSQSGTAEPGAVTWLPLQTEGPTGAQEAQIAEVLVDVDPNAGPIYKSTPASRASGQPEVPYLHPGIQPLLSAPDVDEWWCYLDNGERVAEVPNPAYWPEIALAVIALVGAPPEPWNLRMMPRKKGEEYATEEGVQTRTLRPEDAAWKDVEAAVKAIAFERDNAREAARYREAVGTPIPPAFFHPVPLGAVQWRILGQEWALLAEVAAHATRKDVLGALYDHLRAEPQEFRAECVMANPGDYSCDSRAFRLSARDLHPTPFAVVAAPWIHISAEPWVLPSRVPAYATREEVARHVRAITTAEWFEEVRLHGVTLEVQPLDVDLIPVGESFTVSLFSQDFQ